MGMSKVETPVDVWRGIGTGIMVCVRLPDGGETVYMGAANKELERQDLEAASRWLSALARTLGE